VGTLLVQFARNEGTRVVALARGERKLRLARDLGADVAIDYGDGDWPRRVRDAVGGVDVAFDGQNASHGAWMTVRPDVSC
jgi:NADPH:quinone reductase